MTQVKRGVYNRGTNTYQYAIWHMGETNTGYCGGIEAKNDVDAIGIAHEWLEARDKRTKQKQVK